MLAISEDSPDDSRAFARDYGIAFSLLSDNGGAVARVYAGVTSDANALPGVTIIRADGRIAFRQVASAKDDRMTAAELFAAVDRTLGTHGAAVADDGYAAIDRAQLRLAAGGGVIDQRATGVASLAALLPLGRHILLGPSATAERESPLALAGNVVVRAPMWANAGAIELGVSAGWAPWGDLHGATVGGNAGMWFAWTPAWAIELGARVDANRVGNGTVLDAVITLGIARLIRL